MTNNIPGAKRVHDMVNNTERLLSTILLGNNLVNDMVAEVKGKSAIEIVNTLIRENYISSLQHSADMGIELCKAELALKYDLKYIQDKDLII